MKGYILFRSGVSYPLPLRVVFLIIFFLLFPTSVDSAAYYSRSMPGLEVISPLTISVSFDDFEADTQLLSSECPTWSVEVSDEINSYFPSNMVPNSVNTGIFSVNLPVMDYRYVAFSCNAQGGGGFLEGDANFTIFSVVDAPLAPALPTPPTGRISYRPEATILYPKGNAVFSSEVIVKYETTDKNDLLGGQERLELGMTPTPVSLFYSDKITEWDHTLIKDEDKTLIVKNLSDVGSYVWNAKDLIPGVLYRVIVNAVDAVGDVGEDVSDFFTVDFSTPKFTVTADPPATRREDVTITVASSEGLKDPPIVSVTQKGGKPVGLSIKEEDGLYRGVYKIIPGYDGNAVVKVSGTDLAGNDGSTIVGGGTFAVGVNPPPAPEFTSPLNKSIAETEEIIVKGTAREDSEVVLTVNGIDTYTVQPNIESEFTIDNVKLNKLATHGENTLSVVARDLAGTLSEATVIQISFNLSPSPTLISPENNAVLSAIVTLNARATDENGDRVLFKFEALPQGEIDNKDTEWISLGESVSGKLIFDTTEISDGKYFIRALADDGAVTAVSDQRAITIKNELPTIKFEDGRRTIVNKDIATVRGNIVASDIPSQPVITALEYSQDSGKSWMAAPAEDGGYNSSLERFSVSFDKLSEGKHDILWRAADSRGFSVRTKHSLIVDTYRPRVPVVSFPNDNATLSDSDDEDRKKEGLQIIISGRAEAGSTVVIQESSNLYKTQASIDGLYRQAVSLANRGKYALEVTSVDVAGNKSGRNQLAVIYNNPPRITFLNPRENRGVGEKTPVRWLIKDSDGDNIENLKLSYEKEGILKVLAEFPKGNSFDWDTTQLPEGSYHLIIEAGDGLATVSKTIPVTIDHHPPRLSEISVPQKVFAKDGELAITGKAVDEMSGVEFVEYKLVPEWENTSESVWLKATVMGGYMGKEATFVVREPVKYHDGRYRVFIRAVDAAGNNSAEKEETITVDVVAPRAGSTALFYQSAAIFPADGKFTVPLRTLITLVFSLEDDTKEAKILLNGIKRDLIKDKVSNLWKTEVSFSETGNVVPAVTAIDGLGNENSGEKTMPIIAVAPPKIIYKDYAWTLPAPMPKMEILVYDQNRKTFAVFREDSSYGTPNMTEDGGYYLALPRGTYRLAVSLDGFKRMETDTFTLDEAQFVVKDIVLEKKTSFWGTMKALIQKLFNS